MRDPRSKPIAVAALAAFFSTQLGTVGTYARPHSGNDDRPRGGSDTATPIKHVIIIIGENHTFDNIYGTYVPKHGESIRNLLSEGIVKADGSSGWNMGAAEQFQVANINPVAYFIDTDKLTNPGKTAYSPFLPTPEAGNAPPAAVTFAQFQKAPAVTVAPFDANTFSKSLLSTISPVLRQNDLFLLTTGATGLTNCTADPTLPPSPCAEPDSRISHFNMLPDTVFQITGPNVPYDSYSGDMVHRFFHMWQQSDCDVNSATFSDPAGCRKDLYPFVGLARGDDSGGDSMGFFNMQAGDAPLFKRLADEYTMSDNYHQPVMGGTAVQHVMLMTGDALPWDNVNPFPATPPIGVIADPTPKNSTSAKFKVDKGWTQCDPNSASNKPIFDYLKSLPWRPDQTVSNCETGRYYMINNTDPAYLANGQLQTGEINAGAAAPPSSLRNIGDALNDHHISWAYYGGGYNAAARFANGSTDPVDVMIGTGGDFYCEICNAFEYSKSIMGDPQQRAEHIKDAVDFFTDVDQGKLPAVSYIKPDSFDDGHPASSKLDLFEALVGRVIDHVKKNDDLWKDTAIIVTFDEGGGYWDSGFMQPIDFFGDGPRIPCIVVSPYSRGGHVVHTYADHASVLKFIERNWGLDPITTRSRDNLPNPMTGHNNLYVPMNMPAIGDLFDMFDFSKNQDRDNQQ